MKKVLIIFLMFLVTGCGLTDYSIDLPNEYKLVASSAHEIKIIPGHYIENMSENLIIPTQIVEIDYNERYIIAKQYKLKTYKDFFDRAREKLDKSETFYWILDTIENKRYGPYTDLSVFEQQKKKFNLSNLHLKNIESFK